MLLVSGATATVSRHLAQGERYLGELMRPGNGNVPTPRTTWAIDNGAYTGFDAAEFCKTLERLQEFDREHCRWCAAPDVVGDSQATGVLFRQWEPKIRRYGYPVALVAQDGIKVRDVPWDSIDALFIGGGTDWKEGPDAARVGRAALERGKRLHMGRVNTIRRMRIARCIGCDSIDGGCFSEYPDEKIPWALDVLAHLNAQGPMPWA